ncbi:DUF551 domain-containing protein [Escherichia coli]|uniref:DUF551 domain-containing protein n=1 Tax=Escherichia coli TaxID=562 RepID=UPI00388E83D3
MTELTKEQLIEEAKLKIAIAKCHPNSEMARVECELFNIALASLEAKPIGAFHIAEQQVDGTSDYIKDGEWPIDNGIIEVYAAPPVPVVPGEIADDLMEKLPKSDAWANGFRGGWNACRAVMLQSGNFREIPETSTSSPGTPAGWISCSDAVPAEYCDVILRDDLGNVFPGSWDKVFCPTRGGNKMAFVDKDGVEVESSTHWMPLPEPPQEVNQ